MTDPRTPKSQHLALNNAVSVGYIDAFEPVYVEAGAEWVEDAAEKQRVWDYFKSQPEPYGFDPGAIGMWDNPEAENFGVLKLTPSRMEVYTLGGGTRVFGSVVWRPPR